MSEDAIALEGRKCVSKAVDRLDILYKRRPWRAIINARLMYNNVSSYKRDVRLNSSR